MATSGEIEKLLRPLLERRSDLVYLRRIICFVPFSRYLRGVAFELPPYPRFTRVACFANQLCNGSNDIDIVSDESVRIPKDWKGDVEGTSRRLCDELERDILPTIEPVTTLEEHLNRFPGSLGKEGLYRKEFLYGFQSACNACTHGDFERAEAVVAEALHPKKFFLGAPEVVTEEHRFGISVQERMAYFLMTLRKGKSETLELLHDWEAFSVKSMKLEKHWKPTPFPCELSR